jgi:hypothetical protein
MKGGCHRQGSLHLRGHIQNEVVLMFVKTNCRRSSISIFDVVFEVT